MRGIPTILIVGVSMAAAGCLVGPDYRRPSVDVPSSFRSETAPTSDTSFGDESWWQVFSDPTLQSLIRTALRQNSDLQLAATRILEAQAQLGITRSNQFPTASAGIDVLGERPSVALGFPSENIRALQVQGSIAWELDFWGRYRRATEAARAQLLASEWGRRAVLTTLVSQVANAYFSLRALDLQLDIPERTLTARQETLTLTQ